MGHLLGWEWSIGRRDPCRAVAALGGGEHRLGEVAVVGDARDLVLVPQAAGLRIQRSKPPAGRASERVASMPTPPSRLVR
jgi:hypothetical protein